MRRMGGSLIVCGLQTIYKERHPLSSRVGRAPRETTLGARRFVSARERTELHHAINSRCLSSSSAC